MAWRQDLGVDRLSTVQRNIVYAATLIAKQSDVIATDDIREHELLRGVSRSTFFKSLKEVVAKGYLAHSGGAQRSNYILSDIDSTPK